MPACATASAPRFTAACAGTKQPCGRGGRRAHGGGASAGPRWRAACTRYAGARASHTIAVRVSRTGSAGSSVASTRSAAPVRPRASPGPGPGSRAHRRALPRAPGRCAGAPPGASGAPARPARSCTTSPRTASGARASRAAQARATARSSSAALRALHSDTSSAHTAATGPCRAARGPGECPGAAVPHRRGARLVMHLLHEACA